MQIIDDSVWLRNGMIFSGSKEHVSKSDNDLDELTQALWWSSRLPGF